VARTYSSGITYNPRGQILQEQFGTTTPIYNKLFYNVRGQLSEIRESTVGGDTSWNRGAIINHYSQYCWGMCASNPTAATDDNGNPYKQDIYIPDNAQVTTYQTYTDYFGYDSLNRLQSVQENHYVSSTNTTTNPIKQTYIMDRYGNRTIDSNPANTFGGVNAVQFTVDTATNRLGVPGGQAGTMGYDAAGNLNLDSYTGAGARTYDAENRMTTAANNVSGTSTYTYDANGRRVRRKTGTQEVWQVYGMDGELVAEYAATTAPTSPQKEYGYKNGQLLVTVASSGGAQWMVADQLGTPRMIFDQTGGFSSVVRHDYLPFGEELVAGMGGRTTAQGYTGNDNVRQKFTQKERDNETGLDYFLARYYSSTQGRFTSPDEFIGGPEEIGEFGEASSENPTFYADLRNPQSLNKYQYAYNNPLRYSDPDGHEADDSVGQDPSKTYPRTPIPIINWEYPTISKEDAERAIDAAGKLWDKATDKLRDALGKAVEAAAHAGANSECAPFASCQGMPGSQQQAQAQPPNPDGQQGARDHQEEVKKQADKAQAEAKPGQTVQQGKRIKGVNSTRRPDVQVVGPDGKVVKVVEVERRPNSPRHRKRQREYDRLNVPHETVPLPPKNNN
jgi:RHS repeat-associated protein